MKLHFRLAMLAFLVIFPSACNSAAPTPRLPTPTTVPTQVLLPEPSPSANAVSLVLDNQKLELEFIQNGASLPCTKDQKVWKVSLKPEPFTLLVSGNKKLVSILALKSMELSLPFQNLSKPLVTIFGTEMASAPHRLYLFDQSKKIEIDDIATFVRLYDGNKQEKITEMSAFLTNKLDAEPAILLAGRTYLDTRPGGELHYLISQIGNDSVINYIQSGNSMALVVFIQKPLDDDFLQLNWVIFNLEFQ